MSAEHKQDRARRARARDVGLFRYDLIADALDPGFSTKQRGRLVRAITARAHRALVGTRLGPAEVRARVVLVVGAVRVVRQQT